MGPGAAWERQEGLPYILSPWCLVSHFIFPESDCPSWGWGVNRDSLNCCEGDKRARGHQGLFLCISVSSQTMGSCGLPRSLVQQSNKGRVTLSGAEMRMCMYISSKRDLGADFLEKAQLEWEAGQRWVEGFPVVQEQGGSYICHFL